MMIIIIIIIFSIIISGGGGGCYCCLCACVFITCHVCLGRVNVVSLYATYSRSFSVLNLMYVCVWVCEWFLAAMSDPSEGWTCGRRSVLMAATTELPRDANTPPRLSSLGADSITEEKTTLEDALWRQRCMPECRVTACRRCHDNTRPICVTI